MSSGAYDHGFEDGKRGVPVVAADGVWRYARTWTDEAQYRKGYEDGIAAKKEEMNR
jgi:hypothetical protein